jgi:hypothetical protein
MPCPYFVDLVFSFENCGWGQEMRLPRPSPPNVLIGGPPGFPLKACGNDGLVGELGVEGYTPFSFSVGERKLMNHFVVISGTVRKRWPSFESMKSSNSRAAF